MTGRVLVFSALWIATAWADPKASKQQVSGNGSYSIKMTQSGGESCRLEAFKGENEPMWQLERCVGSADDLFFISNDGTRFWVLKSTPEKPGPPHGKVKGIPWYKVEVATMFDAQGNTLQTRRLMDLVAAPDRAKVRQLGKHFIWLEGVDDVPGKMPRVNDAGQVEFEVAGARTLKLNF